MVNLLKTFAKGILYIIGLPFFIVALLLFGVPHAVKAHPTLQDAQPP